MAGYTGDRVPPMQKRMIDTLAAIPGVESVGLADGLPLVEGADDSQCFHRQNHGSEAHECRRVCQHVHRLSRIFSRGGHPLLAGRTFTWHDDKDSPRVAIVNQEFARRMFGSPNDAIGRYFKMPDGTRIQVVGIAEDGKYGSLTEDPQMAMFLPILQSPPTGRGW